MDGSKAIRGGIPIVFPQFGKGVNSPRVQHGFARSLKWRFVGQQPQEEKDDLKKVTKVANNEKVINGEEGEAVTVMFELDSDAPEICQTLHDQFPEFPYAFTLSLTITLSRHSLKTTLTVLNAEKEKEFGFTALLHTYFAVEDVSKCSVGGLRGCSYIDKLLPTAVGGNEQLIKESNEVVKFEGEVDRVYVNALSSPSNSKSSLTVNDELRITTDGFSDVVVWNPWIEKGNGMSDMPTDGYKKMVCVEVGCVHGSVRLGAGERWSASQLMTVVPSPSSSL